MPNITKRFVESITPDPKKLIQYWDTTLKGFGVIVLPSGRRTYCIQYRNQNRVLKRLKIGVHGQIRTEEARAMAKNHLGAITQGRDPAEQKKVVSALPTIADLAKEYMERHGTRKRTSSQVEDRGMLKKYILPAFAHQPVAQVTFHDIQSLHLKLKDTPYRANRVMALLSSMFSLSISWSWRPDNPVRGIKKYQEEKRDRWLDEEELNRLWAVLDTYPSYLTAYVFKLLLLTGARKSEVTQATWNQFDLKKGVWIKPSHMTKQKKKEHLPLSEKALEVLETLRKLNTENSPYLFPGRVGGEPLKTVTNFWRTVIKKAGLEKVRIHDLRHTHASHLVSSGLSLSIVGKLLGHTQASTTQRYAHLADEPLRQAAEVFGRKIGNVTQTLQPSEQPQSAKSLATHDLSQ